MKLDNIGDKISSYKKEHPLIGDISVDVNDKKILMHCNNDDYVVLQCHYGHWEEESRKLWINILENIKIDIVLDIGAYTGIYALIAQCVDENVDIYTFEPLDYNFKRVVKNCELNSFNNIKNYNVAVSNTEADLQFEFNHCNHAMTTGGKISVNGDSNNLTKCNVKSIIIDNILQYKGKTILLKIDVEGFEIDALRGMKKLLENNNYIMLIEILDAQYDKTTMDIKSILPMNYMFKIIGEDDNRNYLISSINIEESILPELIPYIKKIA